MMHRPQLWDNFLTKRSDENKRKFSKKRNYGVSLLRKTKKTYQNNLNEEEITENKTSKMVKPFLSDKIRSDENKKPLIC